MTPPRLVFLILTIASIATVTSCGYGSEKSKIANTIYEYVKPDLTENESFGFVGLSNHRDTVFMRITRPCIGVIYTITDNVSGEKTRHFVDVIFSDDYRTTLYIKELDSDPIEMVRNKMKEELKKKYGKNRVIKQNNTNYQI